MAAQLVIASVLTVGVSRLSLPFRYALLTFTTAFKIIPQTDDFVKHNEVQHKPRCQLAAHLNRFMVTTRSAPGSTDEAREPGDVQT